jgi:hypothetical protein
MSSFPPADWEVRYLQDMDTFTVEPDGNKLCLAALLAVKQAGAMEGNFRLTLTGTEDISIRLNVANFIPHKAMEVFTVVGQFHPGATQLHNFWLGGLQGACSCPRRRHLRRQRRAGLRSAPNHDGPAQVWKEHARSFLEMDDGRR